MKRPRGVTAVAVLLVIVGLLNIVSGLNTPENVSGFLGSLQAVIGALAIACGIGCWQLRRWAQMTTVILMGLNAIALIAIWIYYSGQSNVRVNVPAIIIPLAFNLIVVRYLLRSEVKAAFQR